MGGLLFGIEKPNRDRKLLTGPYRAISADQSFVIQVDGIPGTDSPGSSSKVNGELLWDCYAEDVEYDRVLTTDVLSTDTGGQLARVTYAVLSDAVEATVEVNLLLPGIIHLYGEITADCPPIESFLNSSDVVLFSRARDEQEELVPSSDDSSMVPLELARSVIAVPVRSPNSRLRIFVQLHARTPNSGSDVPLEGNICFDFDKHTGEIRVESYGDIFVPVGTDPTGGSSASRGSPGDAASAGQQGTEQTSVQQCKVQVNITSPGFHMMPPPQVSSPGRRSPTREEFHSIS